MENKKISFGIGILLVLTLFSISYISAFAISSAYWEERALELTIGETKDIALILQNEAGNQNISAIAEINAGSEIAEIIDSDNKYLIPSGGRVNANIRISIPNDAKIGDTYTLRMIFTTVDDPAAGVFGFGSSIGRTIPIVVVPTTEQKTELARREQIIPWVIYSIIGIIVLGVIIWLVLKKKK